MIALLAAVLVLAAIFAFGMLAWLAVDTWRDRAGTAEFATPAPSPEVHHDGQVAAPGHAKWCVLGKHSPDVPCSSEYPETSPAGTRGEEPQPPCAVASTTRPHTQPQAENPPSRPGTTTLTLAAVLGRDDARDVIRGMPLGQYEDMLATAWEHATGAVAIPGGA